MNQQTEPSATTKKKRAKKVPAWRGSKAKDRLHKDIVKNIITRDVDPVLVYYMRKEYQLYKYENFKQNLQTLFGSVESQQGRATRDAAALENDMKFARPPREVLGPFWNGSNAKKLLEQDIAAGSLANKTPQQIWNSRPEYQEFELDRFRNLMFKHINKPIQTSYWLEKMKKKFPDSDDDE
jgi:hypothetical protein